MKNNFWVARLWISFWLAFILLKHDQQVLKIKSQNMVFHIVLNNIQHKFFQSDTPKSVIKILNITVVTTG